ncbi:MAG TPA: glycerophosphodiester phosphodiesterase [Bacillus sp. (in: firmicutes)]|uniref:glycerophosphodiester phosphodiesterase n=1 Tax=Bacillus litorisediminis TaxID=2922713 RepID=UPI001FB0189B|nr:glycerophosphodiester phosphodiesterase [Bacillus litorisediminis]HWO76213.1 glycerophosphodiester phosphodiesterase [Bacillus sp. (in: firmicutes)]
MTLIFAHRGSSKSEPENTMPAFKKALKDGADGIELDVQLTKDGEVVVIHDEKVDRTTNGKGYVKDYSLQELQKLHVKSQFPVLHKVTIPTLIEVFEWLSRNNLLVNIELKNGVFPYHSLEEKVIQLIRLYRYEQRVILSSFNHYSIVHCYQLAPDIETAPIYKSGIYMPWVYAQSIRARGLHPHYLAAPDLMVEESLKNGVSVRPWTVNKEKDIKRLLAIGCSAIITDYPKKAVEYRNQIKKLL